MTTSKIQACLLWPLGLLYGGVTYLRNKFYDRGWYASYQAPVFSIVVGNLSMGGTGKTPMVEYLIRLLSAQQQLAILSRGYGRQNAAQALIATAAHTAADLGDEPMQYVHKFPKVTVAVDADRWHGIKMILQAAPKTSCIILDDAFQHRRIRPHLSILLTDYSRLYSNDFVVPAGSLREFRSGAARANIIVVSKCPSDISATEKQEIYQKLGLASYQKLLFSSIGYQAPVFVNKRQATHFAWKNAHILLLTGIAKAAPLRQHIQQQCRSLHHLAYRDHYNFNEKALLEIKKTFEAMPHAEKYLITTEKDWQRLKSHPLIHLLEAIPIAYIPISTTFSSADEARLLQSIEEAQKNLHP